MALPKARDFTDEQIHLLCASDPEIIDFELKNGVLYPVIRAFDNLSYQLWVFCIHCNTYHYHGRGGPDYPFQIGRGGSAGHRVAECRAINSPFIKNGYILDVIATTKDMPKHHKRRGRFTCRLCGQLFSAAFNTCSCGFSPSNKSNTYKHLSEIYRNMQITSDYLSNNININHYGINNGIISVVNNLQNLNDEHKK